MELHHGPTPRPRSITFTVIRGGRRPPDLGTGVHPLMARPHTQDREDDFPARSRGTRVGQRCALSLGKGRRLGLGPGFGHARCLERRVLYPLCRGRASRILSGFLLAFCASVAADGGETGGWEDGSCRGRA